MNKRTPAVAASSTSKAPFGLETTSEEPELSVMVLLGRMVALIWLAHDSDTPAFRVNAVYCKLCVCAHVTTSKNERNERNGNVLEHAALLVLVHRQRGAGCACVHDDGGRRRHTERRPARCRGPQIRRRTTRQCFSVRKRTSSENEKSADNLRQHQLMLVSLQYTTTKLLVDTNGDTQGTSCLRPARETGKQRNRQRQKQIDRLHSIARITDIQV